MLCRHRAHKGSIIHRTGHNIIDSLFPYISTNHLYLMF